MQCHAVFKEGFKAFGNTIDAIYIAEAIFLEIQYIERDPQNNNIRLAKLGRDNCGNPH